VPVRRLIVALFVLNSTLTAFGGLLLMARLGSGDPRSGSGLELTVIAVIVLGGAALSGGRGTMAGSALGVLVFGVISASTDIPARARPPTRAWCPAASSFVAVVITASADLRAAEPPGFGASTASSPPRSAHCSADAPADLARHHHRSNHVPSLRAGCPRRRDFCAWPAGRPGRRGLGRGGRAGRLSSAPSQPPPTPAGTAGAGKTIAISLNGNNAYSGYVAEGVLKELDGTGYGFAGCRTTSTRASSWATCRTC